MVNRIKKLLALALSFITIFTMLGCVIVIDGENSALSGGEKNGTIGLSVSTQNNPFFVTLVEGAEAAANELGVKLSVVGAGDDVTKQVSDIEDLVSQNISVLIVNSVDSDAVTGAGKNIMVVGFDATDDAIAAIKASKMGATIAQQPDLIGKKAVENAVKLIAGEQITSSIPVEVTLITKDNA